ncbi:Mor transcription activator family protein [Clostridium botulinum]|nr:Mor transcription activator family protein [Clostridium botulinum]NFP01723.1 Mor transcription activator family protein [Clostridium botulinum]
MSIDKSDFNGIYEELIELLGLDVTVKIHEYFKGQQVNFPMRLHSKTYVMKELQGKSVSDSKELAKELGYTDNWIRKLLKKIEGSNGNE